MKEFVSRSLNPKNFARGTLFFILCTIVGLYLSFLRSDTANIGIVLRSMNEKFLLLAVLCMFCDWLSGGARLYIFVRRMSPHVTFLHGLRANLATLCIGGITPFQTGGLGHLYIFNRAGVPFSGIVTTGVISFIGTLTFLMLSTGYVVQRAPDFLPKAITLVSQYSLLMFAFTLFVFLLLLIKPETILLPLTRIQLPERRGFRLAANILDRLILTLENVIVEHKAFTRMFVTEHKLVCLLSFVFTMGIYTSRFVGGYVIVRALGGDAPFWHVIAVQVIISFVTLFAPSPGASGISEFLIAILMKPLLHSGALGLYALITRFFTTYCAVAVGGIVLMTQLTKDLRNREMKENEEIEE
ncbi:hypothetical protein C6502_05450 [Candidatus Poribacteria bacterium]|nr:MAG: hypothetical protein C6502_05450 [Candidatus Poribacteria bacterium]